MSSKQLLHLKLKACTNRQMKGYFLLQAAQVPAKIAAARTSSGACRRLRRRQQSNRALRALFSCARDWLFLLSYASEWKANLIPATKFCGAPAKAAPSLPAEAPHFAERRYQRCYGSSGRLKVGHTVQAQNQCRTLTALYGKTLSLSLSFDSHLYKIITQGHARSSSSQLSFSKAALSCAEARLAIAAASAKQAAETANHLLNLDAVPHGMPRHIQCLLNFKLLQILRRSMMQLGTSSLRFQDAVVQRFGDQ